MNLDHQPVDQPIVCKVASRSNPAELGMSLQPVQNRELVLVSQAESLDKMRKKATVSLEHPTGSTFQIICDEGPQLGGDDSAPPPLAYFSASLAFCLLTQLSRYATVKKLNIKQMKISQETRFLMEGSIIKGTLAGRGVSFITHIEIESDESEEEIRKMMRVGENSCFIMQSVINPVPSSTTLKLNGAPIQF